MSKQFKSPKKIGAEVKTPKGKLSLYPLSLETALGAALQTGGPPDRKPKKPVNKLGKK